MIAVINFNNAFEMPLSVQTFAAFRSWSLTAQFPVEGRIDFVNGRIEIDMSPEDLFTHGTPKGDIFAALHGLVRGEGLGHLFVDRTRLVSAAANLSAEPDIVFVSHDSVRNQRVRFVPKASGEAGRFVEIEGGADLVVEIVSDSSATKDNQYLPAAYFAAGVAEYWLIDARGEHLDFDIHRRGTAGYVKTSCNEDGYLQSDVFAARFRLERQPGQGGYWEYTLHVSKNERG